MFIEVGDPQSRQELKGRADIDVRHDFPNGFSATIPATARRGIEKRPGVTVHDVPIHHLSIPSDQTPYGIEQIYDDPGITSTSGGAGVVIGHVDTGVDVEHPDLAGRIVGCKDTTKKGIRNGCNDTNGHGTHTAGTAVADGASGSGIFGVASGAGLYSVKVCGAFCFTDDIAAAIDFLGDKVQIITMSLGGDTESGLIRDAINRNPDILYVAAAGNDGPAEGSIDYPAANPNVIAVAAIDSSKRVASFSSRGIDDGNDAIISEREVEFAAAGVSVESTWKDGGHKTISGTSMATPHIAGLAAREWQGTAADTRAYLRTYAEDITLANGGGATTGYDTSSGYGLGHVTPSGPPNEAPVVSITSPDDDTVMESEATMNFVGTVIDTEDGDLTDSLVWSSDIDGSIGTGGIFSTTLSDGIHAITASVTDSGSKLGSASISITVGSAATTAATVSVYSITYATEGGRNSDKHLIITVSLVDDLGNPVSGASVSIDLFRDVSIIASGTGTTGTEGTVTFSLKNAASGCYITGATNVTANDLTWDSVTPANEFCKA